MRILTDEEIRNTLEVLHTQFEGYKLIATAQRDLTARLVREETLKEIRNWVVRRGAGSGTAIEANAFCNMEQYLDSELAKLSQGVMPE